MGRFLRSCPAMTESFRPNQNFVGYVRGLSCIIFSVVVQTAEDLSSATGKRYYLILSIEHTPAPKAA
jgi:hypothetical protein